MVVAPPRPHLTIHLAHPAQEAIMSTILIIVVIFLLLGGGGYFGFRGRR
jgi:hypothetical protein